MPGRLGFPTQGSEETRLKRPREPLLGTLLPGRQLDVTSGGAEGSEMPH